MLRQIPNGAFPGDPYYEERTITVNGEAEIPVYAGHIYEITANIAMPGGNDLVMSLPSFPQSTGEKVVYGSCDDPIQSAIPDEAGARRKLSSPIQVSRTIFHLNEILMCSI